MEFDGHMANEVTILAQAVATLRGQQIKRQMGKEEMIEHGMAFYEDQVKSFCGGKGAAVFRAVLESGLMSDADVFKASDSTEDETAPESKRSKTEGSEKGNGLEEQEKEAPGGEAR